MAAIGFYTCAVVFVLLARVSVLTLKERKEAEGNKEGKTAKALENKPSPCP